MIPRLSVIVAAGDELVHRWLVSTLDDMGTCVQEAFCGWDVLRLLSAAERADLVISDLRLRSPGGLRTVAMARTIGIDVPFLLVANPADVELSVAAVRLGARVLARPLSAEALARMIRTTCRIVPARQDTLH